MEDFIIENGILVQYKCDGGDVVIPEGVTKIGDYAFYRCNSLTSINIPDSVTKIGDYAFYRCNSLTSINIPDSVTKIGDYAFYRCNSLTSINIPDSVKKIGNSVFRGCSGLTSIVIPDSVTIIDDCAFWYTKTKRKPQSNVAYKGFNDDMTCRGFQYKEGETYVCEKAKLCECGFHACLNPLDCFGYYSGENAVYHEVILEDRTGETNESDSKVCGRKITIGRRLTLQEMAQIFNELNK